MELNRVKEILTSNKEIPVHFHGVPIWIEDVDETSSMATVHSRGSHEEKQLVSIDALTES
ncbi:H-type small acid-soluble spore protein [Mesobacillus harenae]|uniref:H-type small acid-soluble spore protein n=1 Tax=Mesobacillus harenae TaxID=2213203 RepID=UPI0015808935|nr:H-type small acid-soluble spore protein [Mesobacillus harenae]